MARIVSLFWVFYMIGQVEDARKATYTLCSYVDILVMPTMNIPRWIAVLFIVTLLKEIWKRKEVMNDQVSFLF